MRFSITTLFAAFLVAGYNVAHAATELSVTVNEGPTECEDEEKVTSGKTLKMHYTGSIDESSEAGEKGKVFDSSLTRGRTFDFIIGNKQVIQGWDEGLIGLCKGAKVTLVIPSDKGYGENGAGADIPGGATLKFDVEIVDVSTTVSEESPMDANLFDDIDTNNDNKLVRAEVDAYFVKMGATTPEELWDSEDQDKDGFISWDEFSGPKGDKEDKNEDAIEGEGEGEGEDEAKEEL